jgi:hypothetical protein
LRWRRSGVRGRGGGDDRGGGSGGDDGGGGDSEEGDVVDDEEEYDDDNDDEERMAVNYKEDAEPEQKNLQGKIFGQERDTIP